MSFRRCVLTLVGLFSVACPDFGDHGDNERSVYEEIDIFIAGAEMTSCYELRITMDVDGEEELKNSKFLIAFQGDVPAGAELFIAVSDGDDVLGELNVGTQGPALDVPTPIEAPLDLQLIVRLTREGGGDLDGRLDVSFFWYSDENVVPSVSIVPGSCV